LKLKNLAAQQQKIPENSRCLLPVLPESRTPGSLALPVVNSQTTETSAVTTVCEMVYRVNRGKYPYRTTRTNNQQIQQ